MVGCSLTEAFPDTTVQAGKVARREERKKAKASSLSPGPALTFLKDADRQSERPPPPPDAMIKEGYADYSSEGEVDVIGKQKPPKTTATASASSSQAPIPSYFGKGADTESFADYSKSSTDNPGYQLQGSDFTTAFSAKGVEKASGGNALPTPSIDAAWKPLSDGSNYYNTHPAPYDPGMHEKQQQHNASPSSFSREEKETLLKKLDTLFARLEELETKRNEYAHAEVTLFILSGLFFIFGLETMRKFK
jgi:hypothetical protein